ncbi:MAG TPA: hypothetical protein VN437_01920 [Rectinemataceae bacterium]|nr:hypothetical protein [Rectinemataceae bacterium]
MTKTSRGAIALFFLAIFAASPFPVFAASKASFYYSIGAEGFSSPLFSSAEYADISSSIELAKGKAFNPAVSAHYLIPANPFSFAESLAGLGVDITLFYLQNHPFAWMFPRKTALAPTLGMAVYTPFANLANIRYTLSLSPFRLFTGYGYFAVGAFGLVFDSSFAMDGWGLKLFEFSYLVF